MWLKYFQSRSLRGLYHRCRAGSGDFSPPDPPELRPPGPGGRPPEDRDSRTKRSVQTVIRDARRFPVVTKVAATLSFAARGPEGTVLVGTRVG